MYPTNHSDGESGDTITQAIVNASGVPSADFSLPRIGTETTGIDMQMGEGGLHSPNSTPEEREQTFLYLRQQQGKMREYVHQIRPAKVEEGYALFGRISAVEASIANLSPEAREAVAALVEQQRTTGRMIEAAIQQNDRKLEESKEYIEQELITFLSEHPLELANLMTKYRWPLLTDCQELQLSQDIVNLVIRPPTLTNDQGSTEMENMRRIILELQEQLRQVTLQQDHKTSILRIPQDKADRPRGIIHDSIDQETIKERRRRVQLPAFTFGDIQKAREWLMEYNSLTHHIRFSEKEKLADLEVRLKGDALSWFTYLPEEDKKTWKGFERVFQDYFGGGASTVEMALRELKNLQQGSMRMVQFGQKFREVARKAEVHSEVMLVSYLKAAVNPEMRKAIVYRGPKTYVQAVDICIEVETDFLTDQIDPTVKSLNESIQQNYQSRDNRYKGNKQKFGKGRDQGTEKRTCFRCEKVGHLKKDCWMNKKKHNHHHNNNQELAEHTQQEETPTEENINIFEHLFENNQQEQTTSHDQNRFKIPI